jgi:hypothetical protein
MLGKHHTAAVYFGKSLEEEQQQQQQRQAGQGSSTSSCSGSGADGAGSGSAATAAWPGAGAAQRRQHAALYNAGLQHLLVSTCASNLRCSAAVLQCRSAARCFNGCSLFHVFALCTAEVLLAPRDHPELSA